MSETKTGVKIPVGWLRLDRGVKTLPGDWWWNHGIQQWCVVGRSMPVRDQYIIIRRCRYKVGEEVIVWKPSGYSPEIERGTAIIDRVYASDHRGVQQVKLKKTGQSVMDSILTSCSSDILAPTFSTLSDRDSAPQMWNESHIINKIDPTNDPNVAPYLANETIDEAPDLSTMGVEVVSEIEPPTVRAVTGALRPFKIGETVYVNDPASVWHYRVGKIIAIDGSFARYKVEFNFQDGNACWKTSSAWFQPDKIVLGGVAPQSDHGSDANKMVGNSSENPNGSAGLRPKTLYIAGPMRGIAWFNYPMFDRIAKQLREQGYEVISPADEDRKQDGFDPYHNLKYANPEYCCQFPPEMDFHRTVRRCLDAVLQCDEIVLLPGWERSSGAVAELTLAMWLNKRVRHVLIDEADQVQFVCFWKGLESLANDLCDEHLPEGDEPGDSFDLDDEDETPDDILEEALKITRGSRNASYGPPDQDFRRTAGMWSALFASKLREGVTFEPRDVALAMILLKTSRETHQRKRDNWVDIAGYARCGSLCN